MDSPEEAGRYLVKLLKDPELPHIWGLRPRSGCDSISCFHVLLYLGGASVA